MPATLLVRQIEQFLWQRSSGFAVRVGSRPWSYDLLSESLDALILEKPVTTVLHVEDDRNDQLLMEAALQQSGLGVCLRSAKSGEEAMEYLHNSLLQSPNHPFPDLLLLDLKLPGMGGLATLASIRADKRLRQMPVYILTDWDSPDAINQARASGAAGFFPKGLGFTDVVAALRVLSSGRAQGLWPNGR